MPRGCKVHFRNVAVQRFASGGGLLYYNIEVDRCAGLVTVREKRRRTVATVPLGVLAKLVMERFYAARVREKRAEKQRQRKVRRGALAFRGIGELYA